MRVDTERIDCMTANWRPPVSRLSLPDGRRATVRPLAARDVDALTTFFEGLSAATRRVYGPHPFDRPTAERLCACIDHTVTVRYIAVLDDGTRAPEIIGYMILSRQVAPSTIARYEEHGHALHLECCARFAPVIGDDYQGKGLGTRMARQVIACAREMNLEEIVLMGGVRVDNPRAKHVYEKLGFKAVGEFTVIKDNQTIGNYDMILLL